MEYRLDLGTLTSADSELVSEALEALVDSAERSERVFAHLDAASAYHRASRLLAGLPAGSSPRPKVDPVDLLAGRAAALGRAGLYGEAAEASAAAIGALGDSTRSGRRSSQNGLPPTLERG